MEMRICYRKLQQYYTNEMEMRICCRKLQQYYTHIKYWLWLCTEFTPTSKDLFGDNSYLIGYCKCSYTMREPKSHETAAGFKIVLYQKFQNSFISEIRLIHFLLAYDFVCLFCAWDWEKWRNHLGILLFGLFRNNLLWKNCYGNWKLETVMENKQNDCFRKYIFSLLQLVELYEIIFFLYINLFERLLY